jgi:hypothetical protein
VRSSFVFHGAEDVGGGLGPIGWGGAGSEGRSCEHQGAHVHSPVHVAWPSMTRGGGTRAPAISSSAATAGRAPAAVLANGRVLQLAWTSVHA